MRGFRYSLKDLAQLVAEGKQPQLIGYVYDLETYEWNGEEYVCVNNNVKLAEVTKYIDREEKVFAVK